MALPAEMVIDERVPIQGESDIVAARQRARELARELGFSLVDQSRIATAMSELARNVVRYATDGRGEASIRSVDRPEVESVGIEIVVSDEGPGIQDIDLALKEGFTSSHGLGLGLSGTKRLMDEFEIESGPGRGTVVTVRKWRR
jgi:serine/threonine-protein kinase RsbT